MTEAINAIGYVRVSTLKQDTSLESQESKIRAMAEIKEWPLLKLVVDRDKFSGDLNRDGVKEVLRMVEQKEVGAVIITKLDRLTRSTEDAIRLMKLMNKRGVALVSIAESLDTKSPIGRFFVRTIASHAELERETIGDRTRETLGFMKQHGMPVGREPYGYKIQKSNKGVAFANKLPLVENKKEQQVIARIRSLRESGASLRTIADALNAAGLTTRPANGKQRGGGPWKHQYIARILAA